MKTVIAISTLASLILAPNAFAGGEQYGVTPELEKRYQALHAARQRPVRLNETFQRIEAPKTHVVGRLDGAMDGMVLLSVSVSSKAQAVLQAQGALAVKTPSRIADNTVFAGRYYRVYTVAPSARDEGFYDSKVGRVVKLELSQTVHGRHVVTGYVKDGQ